MATQGFGASFGDPSRYMGQSPLADIGKALKTFGMISALEKSGAVDYLNKLNVKQNESGKFGVTGAAPPPNQSAVPVSPAMPAAVSTPISQPQITPASPASQSIGHDVMDDKYYGSPTSFVNPMNINDFNPVPLQDGYTPQLAGDFDFQNLPGYGSAANKLKMFAGMA
jgi:hypothetical protein